MKHLFSSILLFFCFIGIGQTTEDLNKVTSTFLETLNEEELSSIQYKFEDSLRTKWTNLPVGIEKRPGLKFGDLSEKSKIKFHDILTTVFSSQGYLKTTSIMSLDDILNQVYQTAFEREFITEKNLKQIKNLEWDYKNYFVSVWNTPSLTEPWGLKFGGHHISINLTIKGDKLSVTPLFLGTDPAEVPITKYAGLRVLSNEEDYGLKLINMLSKEQKKIATISNDVPKDIITNPSKPQRINDYYGIKASDLNEEQKHQLILLIKEYVNNLETRKVTEILKTIKTSGVENIYFAWIGSYERRKPHYYIIHSPDFIIEYDNVGFRNDGNHIHSIFREKKNDFGEDILKSHYLEHKH
ncbi:DUF3500 domain-containing protein [Seonamhaeicola maritimus]|uniref:DUF3500 domain-containing protein n=1 Tax=Seonamhaeicola maritimus TaxID=2591822 RepID=A0A5C7GEE7_9FLAO|nr:DUF3500 domain-containing protein [Seonamhaeicola maritimus]TXG35213.1 DUF3500 domain-containing protein [Seonamhaeicola maritimus]